jgi:hypothetical protein
MEGIRAWLSSETADLFDTGIQKPIPDATICLYNFCLYFLLFFFLLTAHRRLHFEYIFQNTRKIMIQTIFNVKSVVLVSLMVAVDTSDFIPAAIRCQKMQYEHMNMYPFLNGYRWLRGYQCFLACIRKQACTC